MLVFFEATQRGDVYSPATAGRNPDSGGTLASFEYTIRVEPDRNVVYLTQVGRPLARDFRALRVDFIDAVKDLEPGFTVVNDQRFLEPFGEEALEVAKQLVLLAEQTGVSRVIRMVPSDIVSTTKILRAEVTGNGRIQVFRVSNPEEAEALLAGDQPAGE